jgi:phosphatidylinositol glycan class A protein
VLSVAKLMGLKTVFSEHSLYNFKDLASINLNKLSKWSMKDIDAAICVSHVCKENFCLRTSFSSKDTFVIPNAVDSSRFFPN